MLYGAGNLLDRPPLTHNADSNPERDSNPCFSLERASPWVVISPTSTPGATGRCHSAGSSVAGPRASDDRREPEDEREQDFQCSEPEAAKQTKPPWRNAPALLS